MKKNIFISSALLAVLTASGCGQKKVLYTNEDSSQGATQETTVPNNNGEQPDSPLPETSLNSLPEAKNLPADPYSQQLPIPNVAMPPVSGFEEPNGPSLFDGANTGRGGSNNNSNPPSTIKPGPSNKDSATDGTDPDTSSGTSNGTGAITDGMRYTTSAPDKLHDFIRARNQRVDANTRQLNQIAAASVSYAQIQVDNFSQEVQLTIKLQEGKGDVYYNLAGTLPSDSDFESTARWTRLSAVGAANGFPTTGTRNIMGSLQCLDMDGGCETMFARLRLGGNGVPSAIVNVVFRNSGADLFIQLPGVYSDNLEYLKIRELLRNTILKTTDEAVKERLETVTLRSWEVVNGRSGFEVFMKSANKELLAFSGPLLSRDGSYGANLILGRLSKESENSDLLDQNKFKLNYANTISEARLIGNNGSGQIKLLFQMRKRANFKPDRFAITFIRQYKPIIELDESNFKSF